jgi:hypothetical protein
MDNAGDFNFFTGAVNSATTRDTGIKSAQVGFNGITALTLDFDFRYTSGGTTCAAIVQTFPSTDPSKCRDIARIDFGKTSKIMQLNVEGLLSKGATQYANLAAQDVNDGVLFSNFQVIVLTDTTDGDYVGTTLSVTAGVR